MLKRFMNNRRNETVGLVRYLSSSERKGKVFAVGDLHGEFYALMMALSALDFDFRRDRLLFVGDVHDRGMHSEKCLDLLREPWVDSVLGNHEVMMLESVDSDGRLKKDGTGMVEAWMLNGGEWALRVPEQKRSEWRRLILDTVPLNWVVERRDGRKAVVCHAEPDPALLDAVLALRNRLVPVSDLQGSPVVWGRHILRIARDSEMTRSRKHELLQWVEGVLFFVHGHTQLKTAGWVNNQLFADTGAVFGNSLTLVDMDHAIPGRPGGIYAWDIASEKLVGYAATNLFF